MLLAYESIPNLTIKSRPESLQNGSGQITSKGWLITDGQKRITELTPRDRKRNRRRQKTRWREELDHFEKNCQRTFFDRVYWRIYPAFGRNSFLTKDYFLVLFYWDGTLFIYLINNHAYSTGKVKSKISFIYTDGTEKWLFAFMSHFVKFQNH